MFKLTIIHVPLITQLFPFIFIDLWDESQTQKKNSKRKTDPFNPDRRRKPITVAGPYIVYMMKDVDIIDDWTSIKKVNLQKWYR